MSFSEKRNGFHAGDLTRRVGDALRSATRGLASPAKQIARVAGSTDRAAENWLAATHAPSAAHLIALMAEFPEVTEAVLEMAGRNQPADAERVRRAIAMLEGRE